MTAIKAFRMKETNEMKKWQSVQNTCHTKFAVELFYFFAVVIKVNEDPSAIVAHFFFGSIGSFLRSYG